MKKIFGVCLLALGLVILGSSQEPAVQAGQVQTFKVGGKAIAIPPPTTEMSEIGYDNRKLMDVIVPKDNRLISAFVLAKDLPKLTSGLDELISSYAMVQVPRRLEYMDFGDSDFKEVFSVAKEELGDPMSSSMKEAEEASKGMIKSLGLEDATINLGSSIHIGCFFSKPDAYGFGMIIPIFLFGERVNMGMGAAIIRVNQKMLYVYLYSEYKDEETVKWLRKATEDWVEEILKANR